MGHERHALGIGSDPRETLDSRLLAGVDSAFADAAERASAALAEAGASADLPTRFAAALRAVLAAAAAAPDRTRLCLLEAPGLGAAAVASKEAGLQRFVELLDRELARERAPAAPLVSEMVVGGVYEVMQRTVRAGDVARLPELADELSRLWAPVLRGT